MRKMVGKVERYLLDKTTRNGTIHISLIDPQNVTPEKASELANKLQEMGTSAIMVGGSTVVSQRELDEIIKSIKNNASIPVILFPNGIAGISEYADAIFFSSLMNSINPYYITGAQALGAPLVKRYGLEVLPMGYIIVGSNTGAAGFVGQALPIPSDKPELGSMYALAAEYLGMRFVYLEAGSGSKMPVSSEMISLVKNSVGIKVIVGGGIKTTEHARDIMNAGADILITGTLIEESSIKNTEKLVKYLEKS
jgi:phosphoglycerol geranylgeranyltransferase